MNSSIRTIYGVDLSLANLKGTVYKPLPNTTLNEKFNIEVRIPNEKTGNPTLKGFCIGNGNTPTLGKNEDGILFYGRYNANDGALHSHIPFIVRELRYDLSSIDKSKYRLRKEIVKDGVKYVAYYMKVIEPVDRKSQILEIAVANDGTYGISNYNTNDASILNPTEIETEQISKSVTNKYIVISDQIGLTLNKDELDEIRKGMKTLGLDTLSNKINELAVCTGLDGIDVVNHMEESFCTQIFIFADLPYEVDLELIEDKGFYREIEIGGMEPISIR